LVWVVIKGRGHIPNFVWGLLVAVIFALAPFHVVIVPKFIQLSISLINAREVHMKRAKLLYYVTKSKTAKIAVLQANAVIPIRLTYGVFWVFDNDFFMENLKLLTLRLFDALIVVEF
ncbi:unnamed protein product, partial [Orchesella dallaii]